jgi:hypothetical protein
MRESGKFEVEHAWPNPPRSIVPRFFEQAALPVAALWAGAAVTQGALTFKVFDRP